MLVAESSARSARFKKFFLVENKAHRRTRTIVRIYEKAWLLIRNKPRENAI